MFCINCGKQIVDTARFCNYCGTRVVGFDENIQQSPAGNPENPLPISAEDGNFPENVENSVDLLKMQNEVSSTEPQLNELSEDSDAPFSENETEETTGITGTSEALSSEIQSGAVGAQHSADVLSAPEASDMQLDANIPISTASGQPAPASRISEQPPINAAPEQPEPMTRPAVQHERRYTLGHIIMCLASTAVMAIAAGVFAGLYFSVV